MTPPAPSRPQPLGPLLAQHRLARGWSQLRTAAELCAASGVPTLSRHEVSRWERQLRVPGEFWLGWLAVVLDVPVEVLADAAGRSRRPAPARVAGVTGPGRLATAPGRAGPGRGGDRAGSTARGGGARGAATG